jgi:hypothetical protein
LDRHRPPFRPRVALLPEAVVPAGPAASP